MSTLDYTGRVAVITGAGAGLGREYALLLASRGAKIVVNDLGGDRSGGGASKQADIVVNEIKANGGIAVANYNSVTDGEKIIQTALDNFGRIDILINNAGILRDRSFPRISNQDWDLIQDVHLKGSFKTTQAAWPIFKKQQYGRIIMTSSNSGVLGNFGQANYAAAKTALIGLANTLAIEGDKYNIHCNIIVPTAASRLTEDILPEFLSKELKPKLIAPVVAYLCHESNKDNGVIIDSAAGCASKVHFVRGNGTVLRKSLDEEVTIESVRDAWDKVLDMSESTHVSTVAEVTGKLLTVLEELKDLNNNTGPVATSVYKFGSKDLALYALGIGISVSDPDDLQYLYENHANFQPFPTFFVLPIVQLGMETDIMVRALPNASFDFSNVLHGEQYVEIVGDLPANGVLKTKACVLDVMNKKSGALIVIGGETYDESGNLIAKNQLSAFIIGAGNFGGKSKPNPEVISTASTPSRAPNVSVQLKTHVDQAAIYRLSGDLNPLHIDSNFSLIAGYKTPILHGMCSMGISLRAVLKTFAGNDAKQFKALKVRFVKPVIPGQTLKIDMWQTGKRIYFKTSIVETGIEVISGAYVDLKMVIQRNLTGAKNLQSNAIFERISDKVAAQPEIAKSVNGIFAYRITVDGKVVNDWTIDLKNCKVYNTAPKDVKADTTLTVSDSDFFDIATGKLNAQAAFMKGKLKITGNIMLTQKLVPLLKLDAKL